MPKVPDSLACGSASGMTGGDAMVSDPKGLTPDRGSAQ
jgi:hypothetical protein